MAPADALDLLETMRLVADVARAEGRYRDAETVQREALAMWKGRPEQHQTKIAALSGLAGTLVDVKQNIEAKKLFEEALALAEKDAGPEHPVTGVLLGYLGELQLALGNNAEAEQLLARSLAIEERAFGSGHEAVARTCLAYALALRKFKRKREAKR
jgi:tetratricopeptide (TPR) repeat protein